jgi:hypothetical protein
MKKLLFFFSISVFLLLGITACEKEEVFPLQPEQQVKGQLTFREETELFDLNMLQKIHDAFVAKIESLSEEGPFSNDNANGLLPQMDKLQRAIDKEDVEKGNHILEKVILNHLQSLWEDGLFDDFEDDYEDLVNIAMGQICPCFSKADLDALDWRQEFSSEGYPTQLQFIRFGIGSILWTIFTIPSDGDIGPTQGILHMVGLFPFDDYYRGVFWANEQEVFDGELTEVEFNACNDVLYEKTRDLGVGDFAK